MRRVLATLVLWLALCAAAAAEQPRIIAFGDSLTAGYGLARDRGLVPVLTRWLAARGTPARLVDHGLSGDTSYGGRVRIGLALRGGADAVIVELGANDLLMGIAPERVEANLDAILTRAGASGRPLLLVGIAAPGGDPALRARWAAIWPRLAARHDALLLPDLYAPISALTADRRDEFLLGDGLHPSAKGVELIVDRLGPVVQTLIARTKAR